VCVCIYVYIYVDSRVRDDINHVAFGNKFNPSPVAEKYWPSARSIGRPSSRTSIISVCQHTGWYFRKIIPLLFVFRLSVFRFKYFGIFEFTRISPSFGKLRFVCKLSNSRYVIPQGGSILRVYWRTRTCTSFGYNRWKTSGELSE